MKPFQKSRVVGLVLLLGALAAGCQSDPSRIGVTNRTQPGPAIGQAVGSVVGGGTVTPPTTGNGGPTTTPPPTGDIASLLDQANTLYAEANAALRAGDLATYQQKVDDAFAAVTQAQKLANPTSTTTSTTAPSTSTTSTTVNA